MPDSPEKLDLRSMDVAADKRRLLKRLFPEAFTESTGPDGQPAELDFEKLKAVLGEHVAIADPQAEKYGLDWPGKRDALKAVQTPALGTLVPCPEESVEWETTKNVFIEGDNLEVLKLLQKAYYGKVKMIYIDPPYNTGNDFVYPDNYAESLDTYLRYTGQIDDQGFKTTTNSKDSGRFHSNWLRMMYPRLYVGKNLLREDGVIFISIDDNEVVNLRAVCDQIFGEDNFIASAVWQKAYVANMTAQHISNTHDYIVIYAKNSAELTMGRFSRSDEQIAKFQNPDNDLRGPWKPENLSAGKYYKAGQFEIMTPSGKVVSPPPGRYWRCNEKTYHDWLADGRITFGKENGGRPMLKKFLSEVEEGLTPETWWRHEIFGTNKSASTALKSLFDGFQFFDTPKPVQLLVKLISLSKSEADDIVLDFFSGSGTAAESVMTLNAVDGGTRRSITVQLPEPCDEASEAFKAGFKTIADIAKERIRRAGSKIRGDWEEKNSAREAAKARSEEKQAGDLFSASTGDSSSSRPPSTISDPPSLPPDTGFRVFKLTPSNFKRWDGGAAAESVEALAQQLEANLDHLAAEATEESILFEILLKAGFELTCPVEMHELAGLPVYSVEDGALLLCLADRVTPALIDAVAQRHPVQFICLDRALHGDDALKVNALETFRACQPEIQFRTV